MTSAEHLVIGSGAGGSLTAALLAEAGRDVLVLEEGPWVPPDAVEPFSLEQIARQYRNAGVTVALGRPPVAYAEGRCVGGSTEVNAGLYHLVGRETLARWRRSHQVADLTPECLAPFARANEAALSVQTSPGPIPKASRLLADGARVLGWPTAEIPRWYRYDGGRPVKQSMTRTYLPRAIAAGARVVGDVRVDRLVRRRDRVAGARSSRGLVTAEHVWLCAGAIGTPALLQRSGISRAIGRTLALHPTVKLVARFPDPIDGADDVPMHQVRPFGTSISFGGSASRPEHVTLALAEDWPENRRYADDWPHMAVYYAAIPPTGRGRVLALPGMRDPLVTFHLTRADRRRLGAGMVELGRLCFAAGAERIHPAMPGGGHVERVDDLPRLRMLVTRSRASVMSVHLFSTVPMGEDSARCPADSYGRLRDVRGLRVNDASLLPDAPGVNPQGTVMAIAARNVAHHLTME